MRDVTLGSLADVGVEMEEARSLRCWCRNELSDRMLLRNPLWWWIQRLHRPLPSDLAEAVAEEVVGEAVGEVVEEVAEADRLRRRKMIARLWRNRASSDRWGDHVQDRDQG